MAAATSTSHAAQGAEQLALWPAQRWQCLWVVFRECSHLGGGLWEALRLEAQAWRTHVAAQLGNCNQYCHEVQACVRALKTAPPNGGEEEEEEDAVPRGEAQRVTHPATRARLMKFVSMEDLLSRTAQRRLRCPKCGDYLVSMAVQRRSADEAPLAVTHCLSCKYTHTTRD